ncbi:MAG: cytochrome C [Planctomycetota bacterium]
MRLHLLRACFLLLFAVALTLIASDGKADARAEGADGTTPPSGTKPPQQSIVPVRTSGPSLLEHYPQAAESGCMACHTGIEMIREPGSQMMEQLITVSTQHGDPAGCVVCHGGDPTERTDAAKAHSGGAIGGFYADPGSPWVNEQTCGQCHQDQVRVQWQSLMMTEAGKIQGVCWAFGSLTGYEHKWANYAVENPADPEARLGTPAYREYMQKLTELEPNVFVSKHEPLPDAPTEAELDRLHEDPTLAAFTYIRTECQRCHHAVKGRQTRGDYRGMGCSSCHIPYGNEGFYEGGDPTTPRDEPGHLLVHSIQGTREAQVCVHGVTYSGVPVETCTTCHDRGKRIGVSFQGLMETPYVSPYAADGGPQPGLHTKHYIAMQQDIHYQKGMTCQDCHTSTDIHGDGFIAAANLAAVSVECADCHGTPERFPWDLPLGFMDEFSETPASGAARGVADEPLPHTRQGTVYDKRDGYLLTARGNPFENVVRDGDEIIVHTAAGKDLRMKPLKSLIDDGEVAQRGVVAMKGVGRHIEQMECYTCHASWTPQCYGCHVKIDYSRKDECPELDADKEAFDWVAAGRRHATDEHRADPGEAGYDTIIPGKVTEQRSYLRWEEPMMGVNGEGRITPVAPGCQPSVTVIGKDGKPVILNKIFRTDPHTEGAGEEGQLAIDMSPTQPHTTTKDARTCESCHTSDKALGYGIDGGKTVRGWDKRTYVELETVDGEILPKQTQPQMEPIEGLANDWSRIVDEEGNQLQTVGHHFQLSRALNNDERARISREGTCLACHQELPTQDLAAGLLHHVAKYTGQLPHTTEQHNSLVHKIVLIGAWAQVGGGAVAALAAVSGVVWWRRRGLRRGRDAER